MQRLLARHRFNDTDRALRYVIIRLATRPETEGLAKDAMQVRTTLRDTEETYQQALQGRVSASAEIEYLDGRLDEVVMNIARDLVAVTRGDRTDARYLKLFGTAPSVAMSPIAGEAQDVYVRNILTRLRSEEDLSPVRHYVEELASRHAALEAAIEKRRTFAVPEASADADRRLALENAKRFYNRLEAQLRVLLDDRALVESYFITLTRAKVEEADADSDEVP